MTARLTSAMELVPLPWRGESVLGDPDKRVSFCVKIATFGSLYLKDFTSSMPSRGGFAIALPNTSFYFGHRSVASATQSGCLAIAKLLDIFSFGIASASRSETQSSGSKLNLFGI